MQPNPIPLKVGQPCWQSGAVARAVRVVANVSKESSHYFLATHAPFKRVRDEINRATIDEQEVLKRVSDPANGHVLAIVQGEPGTGKSHLIRWLHLQYELAVDSALSGVVPVLVQRRSGSLRDALEQIVDQLPTEYSHHVRSVREAIGTISASTARETLLAQLQLELGPRWERERARAPLARKVRALNELCLSKGTRRWLLRDDGVIARTVALLTSASSIQERESLPEFTADEFAIPESELSQRDNNDEVLRLADDFAWAPAVRALAAQHFNTALRPALKEMSGLGGTRLRDLFDAVRTDLREAGQTLALFIEDVSVMSALDEEVFNAVEPQDRAELCRLVAVVGMTELGARRLRDNQNDRITHRFSLGEDIMGRWRGDRRTVAEFTARYLNAARLPEEDVRAIASVRQSGADVTRSACERCPVKPECHAAFDSVTIGPTAIGLFPFTPVAPQRLLTHLDERRDGVRQNPRGLLERVMRPLLADIGGFKTGEFPRAQLPLDLPVPSYWDQFERRYCGGWTLEEKSRLRLVAQGWIEADTTEDAASALAPLCGPLGFPAFSDTVDDVERRLPRTASQEQGTGSETPGGQEKTSSRAPAIDPRVDQLFRALDKWVNQQQRLDNDTEARELLHRFIRDSVPWEDESLPMDVFNRLAPDKRYIKLEDQRSSPATTNFFLELFPRSEETATLVRALARHKYDGSDSWQYPGAEADKRFVSRWLRRHRARVVAAFQPANGLALEPPVAHAVHLLAIAALARRGIQFPSDSSDVLRELLTPFEKVPRHLTGAEASFFDLLVQSHPDVKTLLLREVDVPQGRTGKTLFVDPLPIFEAIRSLPDNLALEPLPDVYFTSYWQTRYEALARVRSLAQLPRAIEDRRQAMLARLVTLQTIFHDAGFDTSDLGAATRDYIEGLKGVLAAQDDTLTLPDPAFDKWKQYLLQQAASVASAIDDGYARARDGAPIRLLAYDVGAFAEATDALQAAATYVARIEKELAIHEAHVVAEGDPDVLLASVLSSLATLSEVEPS